MAFKLIYLIVSRYSEFKLYSKELNLMGKQIEYKTEHPHKLLTSE